MPRDEMVLDSDSACDEITDRNLSKQLRSKNKVYVSLGTNIDREFHLRSGIKAIQKLYGVIELSSVYESDPVGFTGEPFYNLVLAFDTTLSLAKVARQLRNLEFEYGRPIQAKKYSSRTLDLDILLYGELIQDKPVQLPREEICYNAFVLWPLAEIAPTLCHPKMGLTFQSMWQSFDKSKQKLRKIPFNF